MEQEEYTREEINWSYVEFVDNQDVLDLIEKVLTCKIQFMFNYHITRQMYEILRCHCVFVTCRNLGV